jgi:hypothetical protein
MIVSEFVMSMNSYYLEGIMEVTPFVNVAFDHQELGAFGDILMSTNVPDLFKLDMLHQSHHLAWDYSGAAPFNSKWLEESYNALTPQAVR